MESVPNAAAVKKSIDSLGYFSVVICVVPTVELSIVPTVEPAQGPIGRCGHRILPTHRLVVRLKDGATIDVIDRGAAAEWQRDVVDGVRKAGWFGQLLGISPHRCDSCKRAHELARTIVCPYCRETIANGDEVDFLTRRIFEDDRSVRDDLRQVVTTDENRGQVVICRACHKKRYYTHSEERWLWHYPVAFSPAPISAK